VIDHTNARAHAGAAWERANHDRDIPRRLSKLLNPVGQRRPRRRREQDAMDRSLAEDSERLRLVRGREYPVAVEVALKQPLHPWILIDQDHRLSLLLGGGWNAHPGVPGRPKGRGGHVFDE